MQRRASKHLDAAYAALRGHLATLAPAQLATVTADRLARSYGVPVAGAQQCLTERGAR